MCSSVDGTLDFYWRIIPDASSTGHITVFSVVGFDGFALDGDFRLDGLGSVGPKLTREKAATQAGLSDYKYHQALRVAL